MYVRESYRLCVSVSTGSTLKRMYGVWTKHLANYAQRLSTGLKDRDLRHACLTVNSADYWTERLKELEEEVKQSIDEVYRGEVDSEAASEPFSALVSKGIRAVVRGMLADCEPAFGDMLKTDWAKVQAVGDESPYVVAIRQVLKSDRAMPLVAAVLSPLYLRLFCDRLAVAFAQRFCSQIYRLKRISELGAQQLLLDIQHLRSTLLELPHIGRVERLKGSQLVGYQSVVSGEIRKVESVLKVLFSPAHSGEIAQQYAEQCPHPSVPDFVKLMELKGLSKSEIQQLSDVLAQNPSVSKVEHVQPKAEDAIEAVVPSSKKGADQVLDRFRNVVNFRPGRNPFTTRDT
eukprot:TRINITY_DN16655_c0_g1_i1.p1 TRINITY_DN16655_c0_g1~~TRINITY_DN16655_c0_g1_i1.p1  ORF type:complete len:345 (+),score=83.77 TRINITY_DN16655_c0_g1_i1:981-2015(+)